MIKAMLRDMRASLSRTVLTLVSIAIAVAAVAGSWFAADTIAATAAATQIRGDVDVVVRATGQDALSQQQRDALAETTGVSRAHGVITGHGGLVAGDGKLATAVTSFDHAATNWDDSGRFQVAEGRHPRDSGEVALDRAVAAEADLAVGDDATVLLAAGETAEVRLSGLFDYRALAAADDEARAWDVAPVVAFDAQTASEFLGADYRRVELELRPDADAASVVAAINDVDGLHARTGSSLETAAAADAARSGTEFLQMLLPFAALALLVSVFVIANTFSMQVTRRHRQLALLRMVGARSRQIQRAVLIEAAVLGLIGGIVGTAVGLVAAPAAMWLLQGDGDLVYTFSPLGPAVGCAAAVAVSVLAALGPANRASRVSPMAALREDSAVPRRDSWWRTFAAVVLLGSGAITVVATAGANEATLPRILALSGAGLAACGALLGMPLFTRAIIPLLERATTRCGAAIRLGLRNAARDVRRTAGTASAVMVGLILVCAIATLGSSLAAMIGSTMRANLPQTTTVLQPAGGGQAKLGSSEVDLVRELPEIDTVAVAREVVAEVKYDGGSTTRAISAIEPVAMGTVLTPEVTAGTADVSHGVLMAQNQADMLGLGLADTVRFDVDGQRPFQAAITGMYEATELSASVYFDVSLLTKPQHAGITAVYATGTEADVARDALETAFGARPDVRVTDAEGLATDAADQQWLAFVIMYAMFGLAIVVAAFGVVNTLALSVMEQVTELGMLRAAGASRKMVRRSIQVEAATISLLGAVGGVTAGIGVGVVMQHAMLGQEMSAAAIPVETVAAALAGAIVMALVAAWWPARWASGTSMVAAIAAR